MKNHQATIESKNHHLVRRYGFNYRYDTKTQLDLLDQLWALVNDRLISSLRRSNRPGTARTPPVGANVSATRLAPLLKGSSIPGSSARIRKPN